MSSIFSTYSTGENRVTASILAVIRSLSLGRIERLLRALLEQSEFELVKFQNQPSKGGKGVPDAMIHASVRILVETKIATNSVDALQLKQHLKRLDDAKEATSLLLVLTPDDARPPAIDSLENDRVVWTSFSTLDQAVDELLDDGTEVVSEREAFLLRELQEMLKTEGLLASPNDVVVVAARKAWPEYNLFSAYVCQPGRQFQQVERLAFYSSGKVYPLVPKILTVHDEVEMKADSEHEACGVLVRMLVKKGLRQEGELNKIFLLSAPESTDTLQLKAPIPNDMKSKKGKNVAFTMGQRYVSAAALSVAKTTSGLA